MSELPHTVISGAGAASDSEAYCPACGQSFPPDHARCPHDGARLVRLAGQVDPLIGRVFEQRYEIRARLGAGGMGAVYRGWQVTVDREVAVKVIDPRLSSNRSVVKRFLREARLSSRLGQPSIVSVYDFGQTEDGILYIVMELVRGHTLGEELERHRGLGLHRTLAIGVQLCDALDAAHKQGIVHRDLKPGNVILLDDPPGRDLIKVLDFGLAKSLDHDVISKVTRSDALLGTPLYMSPEQIASQPTDPRSDLYALGCMLHEMLSGGSPFVAPTVERVLANHIYELAAPLPADAPPALADLIQRLIAKHPADRPQTAAEVRDALFAQQGRSSGLALRPPVGATSSSGPVAAPITLQAARGGHRRAWLGGLALAAVIALAAIALVVTRAPQGGGANRAAAPFDGTAPPSDARHDSAADPAPSTAEAATAAPIDAAVADAARDARAAHAPPRVPEVVRHPPPRPPRRAPPPDAGSELEFYRPDAGR